MSIDFLSPSDFFHFFGFLITVLSNVTGSRQENHHYASPFPRGAAPIQCHPITRPNTARASCIDPCRRATAPPARDHSHGPVDGGARASDIGSCGACRASTAACRSSVATLHAACAIPVHEQYHRSCKSVKARIYDTDSYCICCASSTSCPSAVTTLHAACPIPVR